MNRTIMICLAVLLILNLSGCAQVNDSKSAANPSSTVSTLQSDTLLESTEPPEPEMIEFQVDRYAVTADGAAYLAGAENTYKTLIDAVCSQKETEPYTVASDVKFDSAFSNVKDFEIDVYGHFVYLSSAEAADEYQNAISTESFIPAAG